MIGKTPDGEVDFVAQRQNERLYVQVRQEIKSEKTEKREYERLLEIRDNYPKYVLRSDEFAGGNYEGIKSMHIADFLLSVNGGLISPTEGGEKSPLQDGQFCQTA